jgi:predicted MPP superfamily phosphohydrolase
MQPYWPLRLIGGLLFLLGVYAFWYEPATLKSVEHPVRIDGGIGGHLRIAVIADLHGGAPYIGEKKIDKVVDLANASKPDLILLTGDYVIQGVVGGSHMPIETIAAKLGRLRSRLGVYAVLGNHDRAEDAVHIARVLTAAGIVVLENRAMRIGLKGTTLYVAGISDYASGAHFVPAALLGVPLGQPVLCFTHSPDVFPELPSACVLTIAGHTHGGQVNLPFLGRLIVPSRYGARYAAGLFHEDGKYLFAATGIGTSILPVRFAVPPEITILDVR